MIDWIKFHHATSIISTMKAEEPWVEESREFFGLIIILTVMAINFLRGNKKKMLYEYNEIQNRLSTDIVYSLQQLHKL